MKKPFLIFLHFGYWLLYLSLLAIAFAAVSLQIKKTVFQPGFSIIYPLALLYLVPNLISFYSFYFWLFSKYLHPKKFSVLIVFGGLVCLISALSGSLLSIIQFGLNQPIFSDAGEFINLTVPLFFIAAVHGIIALVIRGFINWYSEIQIKEELLRKNHEMESALIKSQLNPHFLFNTINNIDVLIAKDAKKASEYLNKLSGILRYMVYETKTEKIPLAKELDYIEKYLELQKIRTTNSDYVNFQMTGEANNLTIAPMILFPFIENAFKHTENKKNLNTIRIRVLIEKDKIMFECENSYQISSGKTQDFGGLGNALVKKRLELTYPEKYALAIDDREGIYEVKLTLL